MFQITFLDDPVPVRVDVGTQDDEGFGIWIASFGDTVITVTIHEDYLPWPSTRNIWSFVFNVLLVGGATRILQIRRRYGWAEIGRF